MKTKFFFIYVFVGIAFLAACLWVFLTGGKSAKAVNAKYRLGGIVLTAWAVLSVVSCDVPGIFNGGEGRQPIIECYDPVPNDMTLISIKAVNPGEKIDVMAPGDTIHIAIDYTTRDKYLLEVRTGDGYELTGELLQSTELVKEEEAVFDVVFSTESEYKGPALIGVIAPDEANPEMNYICGLYSVNII